MSLHPKVIDFGDIDVGDASEQLSIHLTNSGHKSGTFVVDLGRGDLEIIVEPMKGVVHVSVLFWFNLNTPKFRCYNIV